jgi:hypothetical protein
MDRRTLMAGLLAGAAASGPAAAQDNSRPARRLAEQWAATLTSHDLEAFAALFSEDYVNHQTSAAAPPPAPGTKPKQATVGFFAGRLKGLPNLNVEIEAIVAGEDKVAASFVYTGTHQGCLSRRAADGAQIALHFLRHSRGEGWIDRRALGHGRYRRHNNADEGVRTGIFEASTPPRSPPAPAGQAQSRH